MAMLQVLHSAVEGNPKASVALDELGGSLGLDRKVTARVFQRLKQDGLAEVRGPGGQIGISVRGVDRIEALQAAMRQGSDVEHVDSTAENSSGSFEAGSFLTGANDQHLYLFDGSAKHAVDELSFYALGGSRGKLRHISDVILDAIPTGHPASRQLPDGTLIQGSNPEIYVVEQGHKRWIPDMETLSALSTHPLFRVSQNAVSALEDGPPMPSVRDREAVATDRDSRLVMVVYGRNDGCRRAMFTFLRALGLVPIEWEDAIAATGRGSPHNLEAVEAAMRRAQAVVVLLSPDDEARLKHDFAAADEHDERELRGQPRQNVILEAGLAMGLDRNRTILVQIGRIRGASDLEGLNLVRMTNEPRKRAALKTRLATAGCALHDTGTDWLIPATGGDFESCLPGPAPPAGPADQPREATHPSPVPPDEIDEVEARIDRFLDLYGGIDQPFEIEVFREAIGVPEDQVAWAAERLERLVREGRVARSGSQGFYPASD